MLLADGGDVVEQLFRGVGFSTVLEKDPRLPRMSVDYTETDLEGDEDHHRAHLILRPRPTPVGLSRKLDSAWNFLAPTPDARPPVMLQTVTLLTELFVVLGDLWNDTRKHHAETVFGHKTHSLSRPDASARTMPGNENAATLPGAAASRSNQPSAEREKPGRQTSRKVARERVPNKGRSADAVGHLIIEE